MTPIDVTAAREAVYAEVEGHEDFVYEKLPVEAWGLEPRAAGSPHGLCAYVDPRTQEPSCLIGRALDRLGLSREALARLDFVGSTTYARLSPLSIEAPEILVFLREHGIDLLPGAMEWLYSVQEQQDQHLPWGEAVALADRRHVASGVR